MSCWTASKKESMVRSTGPSDTVAPILIFTYGNPSRGDDGLGPVIFELLEKNKHACDELENVELLTDFQLQIEHTVDLENRARILFIDASVSATAPFEFYRLKPAQDDSYSTHAMSPESLLATYEKVNKAAPPPAFMLSVRGYEFGLGLAMSDKASANLDKALEFIKQVLATTSTEHWNQLAKY